MCVITTKDKMQSKLADKGTTCMFFGYNVDHASDVYRNKRRLNLGDKRN
jgi:hypothetical protein